MNAYYKMYSALQTRHSLADFQKDAVAACKRIKTSGAAELVTIDGKVALVLASPRTFLRFLGEYDSLATQKTLNEYTLKMLRTGEMSLKELKPIPGARGIPAKEFIARLRRGIHTRKSR